VRCYFTTSCIGPKQLVSTCGHMLLIMLCSSGNNIPDLTARLSPIEVFSKATFPDHDHLKRTRVFGCPVYALHPTLQDAKKLPNWQRKSWKGVFLGFSPNHSTNVALVLNPETGSITPQYHVVFDEKFSTTSSMLTLTYPLLLEITGILFLTVDMISTIVFKVHPDLSLHPMPNLSLLSKHLTSRYKPTSFLTQRLPPSCQVMILCRMPCLPISTLKFNLIQNLTLIILTMILTLLLLTLILNYLLTPKPPMSIRKRLLDQADKFDLQDIFVFLFCYQISPSEHTLLPLGICHVFVAKYLTIKSSPPCNGKIS
jgi:hypothetical protein